jgi:hypothetical protein
MRRHASARLMPGRCCRIPPVAPGAARPSRQMAMFPSAQLRQENSQETAPLSFGANVCGWSCNWRASILKAVSAPLMLYFGARRRRGCLACRLVRS